MIRPSAECGSIYLYRRAADMRKSINGLVSIVEGEMVSSFRETVEQLETKLERQSEFVDSLLEQFRLARR